MLRGLSDDEYERFIHYMESSSNLVLEVMLKEKEANVAKSPGSRKGGGESSAKKPAAKAKAKAKTKPKARSGSTTRKKAPARKRKRAPAQKRKPA